MWRLWLFVPGSWRGRAYIRLAHWYNQGRWSTWRLPFGLLLKYKFEQDPEIEASNARFVEVETSIPIPQIHDVLLCNNAEGEPLGLIVMDWVEGETLADWIVTRTTWPPEFHQLTDLLMNDESRNLDVNEIRAKLDSMEPTIDFSDSHLLVEDLRRALSELRTLPAPSSISGLGGRPLLWLREFGFGTDKLEPIENVAAFHQHLMDMTIGPLFLMREPRIMELAKPVLQKQHTISFTHGDLHSGNILVHNGRLTAIVDWECAGWYPEYWEYTSMHHHMRFKKPRLIFWDAVWGGLGRYQQELAMEKALWSCTGDYSVPFGHYPALDGQPKERVRVRE